METLSSCLGNWNKSVLKKTTERAMSEAFLACNSNLGSTWIAFSSVVDPCSCVSYGALLCGPEVLYVPYDMPLWLL